MAPRARTGKTDDEQPAEKVEETEQAEEVETGRDGICVQCWPDGWPSEDSDRASCVHGAWKR